MNQPVARIPFLTDSYKPSQWKQYPNDMTGMSSYFEARTGAMFPETMFFGLQAMIYSYLEGRVLTADHILWCAEAFRKHFGRDDVFNKDGWMKMLNKHGGHLPIEIRAVPEGMVVPNENILMDVESTDEEFPWVVNYLETLLVQLWYPCTVATMSREVKKIILRYLEETGDPKLIDFKLHDFGFRGSSSVESAGIGGMAHLVNFMGTDTLRALDYARHYYGEDMAGFSIPASEHSTMTARGRDGELEAFSNMLDAFPNGLVACVSDSYDIFNAVRNLWGDKLRDRVMERDGCLVIRPDSGHPSTVVAQCCDMIWERFGGTENQKGYKVFDPHVRLIQGDGIEWFRYPEMGDSGFGVWKHTCESILERMKNNGFSADNIAFGSGGGLLQKLDRDTQKFAFKCSAIRRGRDWCDVSKDPVTAAGKKSKAGRLSLVPAIGDDGPTVMTVRRYISGGEDILRPVFRNGEVLVKDVFSAIRKRAAVETQRATQGATS